MVHHIMRDAIHHIDGLFDGSGHAGFHPAVPVAGDINNQGIVFHPFQVLAIDDMVFTGGVPQDAVDHHVVAVQFFSEQGFLFPVILDKRSSLIRPLTSPDRDICLKQNCIASSNILNALPSTCLLSINTSFVFPANRAIRKGH